MTEHTGAEVRMFPALRVMERQTPPLKYGRPPYWRAPVVPASEHVYIPTWNWQSILDFPEGEAVTVLDVVAAYLAALGSVDIAHSQLIHRGPLAHLPAPREVAPGYYRITVPYWAFEGTIVHPLGNSSRVQTEDTMWVAAPTLILLLELEQDGHLGQMEILDSWTPDVTTTFRAWSERLRSYREERINALESAQTETRRSEMTERYNAFKQGYSAALSMMLAGENCLTRRPDWAHHVYAQHAAATWRKAWRFTFTGRPLVSMGAVDEIAVLSADIPGAIGRPKPPFRLDPTGRQIGALKPKSVTVIGCEPAQRADSITLIDDLEDTW